MWVLKIIESSEMDRGEWRKTRAEQKAGVPEQKSTLWPAIRFSYIGSQAWVKGCFKRAVRNTV